jgi:FG-GAP repeat
MRTMRWNLMVGFMMLLFAAGAAPQGAGRTGGDHSADAGPWRQLAKLTESKGKEQDWLGWSVAVSKDGNTVAVGAAGWCPQQGFNGCGQGAIFVFVKPASGWADMTETALLTASDGQPGEYLGESVAISDDGSTIVGGSPKWPANNQENGALYVFVRPQTGWVDETEGARLTATDIDTNLGQSVGMDGRTIVGGAEYFNGGQGAAFVFVEPTTGWANRTQTARLTPSDGTGGAMGDSVSISRNTVVAGAPVTGVGGAGNGVYVFVKPKSGWKNRTEAAKLTASDGIGFELGYSVSISGDTIAAGAPVRRPFDKKNGAVYVFLKPNRGWRNMTETALLKGHHVLEVLGYSVSLDPNGTTVAAGGPGWPSGGATFLFIDPENGWRTTSKFDAKLTATDRTNGDRLGFSVSASATTTVAGAPYAQAGSNPQQGAVYVFGR